MLRFKLTLHRAASNVLDGHSGHAWAAGGDVGVGLPGGQPCAPAHHT